MISTAPTVPAPFASGLDSLAGGADTHHPVQLVVGRYRLDRLVGRGGMAEVYCARDMITDQVVAVKIPYLQRCNVAGMLARFRREQQVLARLDYPSIVAVLDHGEEPAGDPGPGLPAWPYIVMQFLTGSTLQELLSGQTPFAIRTSCKIMVDVVSALEHAHRHGVIHADVSPRNVMIHYGAGATVEATMIDFGATQMIDEPDPTVSDTLAWTPRYMAPEQARGEPADARTDIYGAGCLFYALLTGQPPFTGNDPIALAYQHVHQTPDPPSTLRPAIPAQIDAVVARALAKNPASRYPTADHFRNDLTAALRQIEQIPVNQPGPAAGRNRHLATRQGRDRQLSTSDLTVHQGQPSATSTNPTAQSSGDPIPLSEAG